MLTPLRWLRWFVCSLRLIPITLFSNLLNPFSCAGPGDARPLSPTLQHTNPIPPRSLHSSGRLHTPAGQVATVTPDQALAAEAAATFERLLATQGIQVRACVYVYMYARGLWRGRSAGDLWPFLVSVLLILFRLFCIFPPKTVL